METEELYNFVVLRILAVLPEGLIELVKTVNVPSATDSQMYRPIASCMSC